MQSIIRQAQSTLAVKVTSFNSACTINKFTCCAVASQHWIENAVVKLQVLL